MTLSSVESARLTASFFIALEAAEAFLHDGRGTIWSEGQSDRSCQVTYSISKLSSSTNVPKTPLRRRIMTFSLQVRRQSASLWFSSQHPWAT